MPTAELRRRREGLRQLDPETVAAIHEQYYPVLYRYARYRLGDAALAEDIAAETIIRLLEAAARGNLPASSLRGWLMGTAANLINQHYRRQYRRQTIALEEQPEDFLSASEEHVPHIQAERRSQTNVLRQALQHLTQEQQHVLALRFGSELSLKETAAVMNKNVNAVKALQFRALASLKRHLEHLTRTPDPSA